MVVPFFCGRLEWGRKNNFCVRFIPNFLSPAKIVAFGYVLIYYANLIAIVVCKTPGSPSNLPNYQLYALLLQQTKTFGAKKDLKIFNFNKINKQFLGEVLEVLGQAIYRGNH